MFRLILFFSIFFGLQAQELEKVVYQFSDEPIDVVIPCLAKDLETLELSIDGIRKNGKNIRRIIVVSKEPLTSSAEWFDEAKFPFTKEEMAVEIFQGDEAAANEFLTSKRTRIGWLYQQLLKLYAAFVIPGISSNVLMLDADVIFLNSVEFTSPVNSPYFTVGKEYTAPYFEHAVRLLPGLRRAHVQQSGIAHHMLFQRPILEDLFALISTHHRTEPWKAFCRCINLKEIYGSAFSEYEIYFNFVMLRTNQGAARNLRWINVIDLHQMEKYQKNGYDYITCHEWVRSLHIGRSW